MCFGNTSSKNHYETNSGLLQLLEFKIILKIKTQSKGNESQNVIIILIILLFIAMASIPKQRLQFLITFLFISNQ